MLLPRRFVGGADEEGKQDAYPTAPLLFPGSAWEHTVLEAPASWLLRACGESHTGLAFQGRALERG
ncbi:hypothetical protein CKO51_00570 [Rhodopirellula sp. SM50]|nr:hypothetical protein CKO51_00570 [Rhodopirellula sp. SM50]